MDDKEFLERFTKAIKNGDCPETLVKMAKTPWQKQVAVEFVLLDKKLAEQEHDIGTLKKICWGIFMAVAIAAVVQVISVILPTILQYF